MASAFDIRLGGPEASESFDPPDDPLGELTPFQMGMRKFCFEKNRQVVIELGGERFNVLLFPDICLAIDWLPDLIADLAGNRSTDLSLPESFMTFNFAPSGDEVTATLSRFGSRPAEQRWELDARQLRAKMESFLADILARAVKDGYVVDAEARAFAGGGRPPAA
jgi:hypothetical protein